jgi:lysophospholipase L1-like esterase
MKRLAGVLLASVLAVQAAPAEAGGLIVAFGDSLTNGLPVTWPSVLQARLNRRLPQAGLTVINAGIAGNRLLHGSADNPAGIERFDRDALDAPGVRFVILLEGVNDIGWANMSTNSDDHITAEQLIAADRDLIAHAHARHVKIFGGTLTPMAHAAHPGYDTPEAELMREAVNRWIRSSREFDAVIDFDAALRDPDAPLQLRPEYDSGDHLHPNGVGEAAMAAAIDLALFR